MKGKVLKYIYIFTEGKAPLKGKGGDAITLGNYFFWFSIEKKL
jgi:hypothetical protein